MNEKERCGEERERGGGSSRGEERNAQNGKDCTNTQYSIFLAKLFSKLYRALTVDAEHF